MGTVDERIVFDIELERKIDERNVRWYDLEYIGESEKGNSIISFAVYKHKTRMRMMTVESHGRLFHFKSPMRFLSIRRKV